MKDIETCKRWYDNNFSIYNSCGETITKLLEKMLITNNIPFHSIEYRIKTKDSFIEKCNKDKYDDPISQITDICGIRIIGYTNLDVKNIQSVIENEFEIDKENSVDKSKVMKDDQVGYRSVHYIAKINGPRANLTEYQEYKGIHFEIQIRTLLQHAWAEIEHDRNYKFRGELPREIKRRFYLVSGTLELLDREFDQIAKDIDTYAENIRIQTEKGILEEDINSTSLIEYLAIKFKDHDIVNKSLNGDDKEIIDELSAFGIKKLKDLDEIISEKILYATKHTLREGNYLGLLRDIMILHDTKKYFEEAWQKSWEVMATDDYEILSSVCPNIKDYEHLLFIENQ